jgi:hypothetical protein
MQPLHFISLGISFAQIFAECLCRICGNISKSRSGLGMAGAKQRHKGPCHFAIRDLSHSHPFAVKNSSDPITLLLRDLGVLAVNHSS